MGTDTCPISAYVVNLKTLWGVLSVMGVTPDSPMGEVEPVVNSNNAIPTVITGALPGPTTVLVFLNLP